MRTVLLIILLLFCLIPAVVSAAAEREGADEQIEIVEIRPYEYPHIKPEALIYGGYRFVDLSGDARADEYEYLHDSIFWGGELRVFSFPHRLRLDLDFKNRKDYFGDVSYAYKDIMLFRGINRTLFHNLDNIRLLSGLSTSAPPIFEPAFLSMDNPADAYGVKTGISNFLLRFKTPDFPAHLYIDGSLIEKDGAQQQRSLTGSGWYNSNVRVSQKRDVDLRTRNIVIGANSHLGPIEIDISHGEKRFDAGGDSVLYHNYTVAGFPPFDNSIVPGSLLRRAGTFPHNLIPEFKGSTTTLRLHTSYTGQIVASATFSRIDRENKDSGAKVEYFIGAGEVTWMPMPRLTFYLKYRHKETDSDNPDTVVITDISDPSNRYAYQARSSISSISDLISGTVRYRPITGLTLRAAYSYENVKRENADEWHLPGSTSRNAASLSADMRIAKDLNLKAKYTHKEIGSPSYNIEADRSDEGRLSVSWTPVARINTLLSYSIAKEKRSDLHFENFDAKNRDVTRDMALGSVTFIILKDLSLTTSYAYIRNKTKQDIVFVSGDSTHVADPLVPYRETARNYAADISYIPKSNMALSAGVSHTTGRGIFYPSALDLLEPVSIASFSEFKARETVYSLNGEYRFRGNIAMGIKYKYSAFSDAIETPYDDIRDGKSHILLFTISKRW